METLLTFIDRHLLSINAIILGIIFIPNLYLNYIELDSLETGFVLGLYTGLTIGALIYEK